jgi:hypothetical protein
VTLFAFSNTDSQFTFKSKEVTTTTEPVAGAPTNDTDGGASEKKTVEETDFADTVVIFALALGAALILAGGFYGRLRSLKLGPLEMNFVGDEEEKKVTEKAADKIDEKISDPEKKATAKAAVKPVALAELNRIAAMGIKPTEPVIDWAASQAAQKVAAEVS